MNRNSDPAPGDLHRHPLLYSSRRQPSCRSDRCASTRSTPLETTRVRWHGPTHRRRGVGERHRIHLSGSRLGPLGCPAAGGWISRTDGWLGCGERPRCASSPTASGGRKTPPRRPFYRGGLGLRAGRRGRRAGSHRSVGCLGAGGTCGIYRPSMWDTHRLSSVSPRSSRQNSTRAWPGRSRRVGHVAEALCFKRPARRQDDRRYIRPKRG